MMIFLLKNYASFFLEARSAVTDRIKNILRSEPTPYISLLLETMKGNVEQVKLLLQASIAYRRPIHSEATHFRKSKSKTMHHQAEFLDRSSSSFLGSSSIEKDHKDSIQQPSLSEGSGIAVLSVEDEHESKEDRCCMLSASLCLAVISGDTVMVDLLLKESLACHEEFISSISKTHLDPSIRLKDKYSTLMSSLNFAVQKNYGDIVNLLLHREISCNAHPASQSDANEQEPHKWIQFQLFRLLCIAAEKGYIEIADLLLTHGAPCERIYADHLYTREQSPYESHHYSQSEYPLVLAAQSGQIALVDLLLKRAILYPRCFVGDAIGYLQDRYGIFKALNVAVQNEHIEVIKVLLQHGASCKEDSHTLELSEQTPQAIQDEQALYRFKRLELFSSLCEASKVGHMRIVKLLLSHGCPCEIEKDNRYGSSIDEYYLKTHSPLFIAAQGGHLELVDLLLQNRAFCIAPSVSHASVHEPDHEKKILFARDDIIFKSLKAAVQNGHVEIVELLIRHGASCKEPSDTIQPFGPVSQSVYDEQELYKFKRSELFSSLCEASKRGDVQIVKLLLENGAPYELRLEDYPQDQTRCGWNSYPYYRQQESAFSLAIEHKHPEVTALLEHAREEEAKRMYFNGKGDIVLFMAIENGSTGIVRWLFAQQNSFIDINEPICDQIPLIKAVSLNHIDIAELIASKGAYLDVRDKNGDTPVHIAVKNGNHEMTALLLSKKKGDINAKNQNGMTPLMCAVKKGDIKNVAILLDAGAIVAQKIAGVTELHTAIENNNHEILDMLLKAYKVQDVSVDLKNDDGLTPLRSAIRKGNLKSVVILLEAGAVVGQKIAGMTELHAAINDCNDMSFQYFSEALLKIKWVNTNSMGGNLVCLLINVPWF